MTKEELIALFSNGHLVTGGDFENLITSLKAMQSPVSDPTAAGTSVTFISNISQNDEGVVSATKKTVNFNGYQTVANMANYQLLDLQQVGEVTAAGGEYMTIEHNMKHYPTVRLLDENNEEVKATEYTVKHIDAMSLSITLDVSLSGSYRYILD